ncbi:MAG: hypothetical protein O2971_06300 [Proteobacteria bacterium]|nr:hypothetical protein [Pseudomonadota bacterium]
MNTKSPKLFLTACVLILSFTASAQDENPFIGTWDIDKPASNFSSFPVPATMSRTYQSVGDGAYMYLVATVNEDGSVGGSSATYKYDSREYPIASLTQNASTTISYRRLNEKTVEYTIRIEGRVSQIGAKTISADGRVLTIAIQTINAQGEINNQILAFNRRR